MLMKNIGRRVQIDDLTTDSKFLHGLSPQVLGRDDEKSHAVYTRVVFLDAFDAMSAG